MTRFYAAQNGAYLGGFDGALPADPQAVEVPFPPRFAWATWNPGTHAWDNDQPSAEQSRLAALDAAIAADPVVTSLRAMTPAQFDAWWDANVTTAATAIAALKRLVKIVLRSR